MKKLIGIRREDKNKWERRVPLVPEHVGKLKTEHNVETILQPFERRSIGRTEYEAAGAAFNEDLSECPFILAVKEIPVDLLMPEKTYMYFSHTIKGQDYNMPMLKKLMDLKCTLIDYECIKDEKGRRLVFFGKYAGLAGMIDAFYGYGQRLKNEGFETPLLKIKPAYEYADLKDAKKHISAVAKEIAEVGLPAEKAPYVFGFAGYGNVSQGAQEIFDIMPHKVVEPDELGSMTGKSNKQFVKVVFKEEHIVKPAAMSIPFELQDYFKHPEKYKEKFQESYLQYLSVLINAIYWDERYPRLLTKNYLKKHPDQKLDVVCDISCDIDGSIEFTYKATESDNPAYVYNPTTESFEDGFGTNGIVNIAVDNLPTELPKDSSYEFSKSLIPFIPGIVAADMDVPFDKCDLPQEIKHAVILYKGELTPAYKYIEEYLTN